MFDYAACFTAFVMLSSLFRICYCLQYSVTATYLTFTMILTPDQAELLTYYHISSLW